MSSHVGTRRTGRPGLVDEAGADSTREEHPMSGPGPSGSTPPHSWAHRDGARHLIEVVRRNWPIVAISTAACLTLAAIYLAGARREYQATAKLLVLQQGGRPLNVPNGDPGRASEGADDYMPTHAMIVRSPLVVSRAIEAVGAANTPSLAGTKRGPVREAIERLTISRPDRSAKVLGLAYRAWSRDEAVAALAAIIATYEAVVEESYRKNNSDVVTLISKARDELKTEIATAEDEYLQFRQANPLLSTDETGRPFAARRLDLWDRSANDAMLKEVQLRSQLALGRELQGRGAGLWAVAHAMNQVGGDANGLLGNVAGAAQLHATDYVRQLSQHQQELSERYGPQYAKVREIQDQIGRIQERQRDSRNRVDGFETRDLLGAIEQSLASVKAMRAEVAGRLQADQAEAKQAETVRFADSNLRAGLERHRALFNSVVEQLKQAQFVSDFGTITTQTLEPSNAPPEPVRPMVALTLLVATTLGAGIGLAAAVASDHLDQRLHSTAEIREALGLPQIGLITQVRPGEGDPSGNNGLISHTQPLGSQAEAYRAIRTHFELARRHHHIGVLLVTSPLAGDGKSTTASNLAICLAQAGRKVLLVDADLRRPTQGQVHGLGSDRGLVQVLRDGLAARQVAAPTIVRGLDLIPAGAGASNPADLLTSSRLAEFLAEVRDDYDVVVVDTPPILSVTDAAIVGALVDGIVLVVNATTLCRSHAERAMEMLRAIEKPVLGAVINRASQDRQAPSYGYGYENANDRDGDGDGDGDRKRAEDTPDPDSEDSTSIEWNVNGRAHVGGHGD